MQVTKREKTTFLPDSLLNKVNQTSFKKEINRNHALKILDRILSKYHREKISYNHFHHFDKSYFQKVVGSRYNEAKTPLIEAGIIEEENDGWYSMKRNICKRMRIAPWLLEGDYKAVTYKEKAEDDISIIDEFPYVTRCLNLLNIDVEGALACTQRKIDSISIEKYKVNEQIGLDADQVIQVKFANHYKKNKKKEDYSYRFADAIVKAKLQGMSLIQDGREYIIGEPFVFIKSKKENIKFSWQTAIRKLTEKSYSLPSRNETNSRLDTILTTLPKKLIPYLSIGGAPLVSFDLANSQFTILAALLNGCMKKEANKFIEAIQHITADYQFPELTEANKEEIERFTQLAAKGGLYKEIKVELQLEGEADAKQIMFVVSFSSHRYHCKEKKNFAQLFPAVSRFIDKFKKLNESRNLPNMLARIESFLFIDGIYKEIQEAGIVAFSKHDSFLFLEKDREEIEEIMHKHLSMLDIEFTVRYEAECRPGEITPEQKPVQEATVEETAPAAQKDAPVAEEHDVLTEFLEAQKAGDWLLVYTLTPRVFNIHYKNKIDIRKKMKVLPGNLEEIKRDVFYVSKADCQVYIFYYPGEIGDKLPLVGSFTLPDGAELKQHLLFANLEEKIT